MAMTKKEPAEVEAFKARLARAESLRDLTIHAPTPVPPSADSALVEGIWWANSYTLLNAFGSETPHAGSSVGLGRRKGVYSHSVSASGTSFAQGPGRFYASRRDALLAVRDAVVEKMAAALAAVDSELAKEA